ncbi:hypothetical protein UES1_171 [Escherichia phage UE-S1]|nr:hypothetical protein UES1_171 [Escherichia phage UE-S1]
MLIYKCDNIRVLQHPYLQIFDVQMFMEGDNPRTYGRKYDYFTVKQCNNIDEVRRLVHELQNKG